MPIEPDPQSRQSSPPVDPFDELYRQYDEATGEVKEPYLRRGTAGRSTPAAKPTSPEKSSTRGGDLAEALFQLAEAVWALTLALPTIRESDDGDDVDGIQA